MNIEELKALKKLVSQNMLTSLDATTAIRFLIDAEIERESITDEDADRAIDWLQTGKYVTQIGDHEYEAVSIFHPDTARFRRTAITALRQLKRGDE